MGLAGTALLQGPSGCFQRRIGTIEGAPRRNVISWGPQKKHRGNTAGHAAAHSDATNDKYAGVEGHRPRTGPGPIRTRHPPGSWHAADRLLPRRRPHSRRAGGRDPSAFATGCRAMSQKKRPATEEVASPFTTSMDKTGIPGPHDPSSRGNRRARLSLKQEPCHQRHARSRTFLRAPGPDRNCQETTFVWP